jgi:predicted small metal-binding protein
MHVIDCDCGATLQAGSEDDLAKRVREHVEEQHPEMQGMSEEELRSFVAEKAYYATDS